MRRNLCLTLALTCICTWSVSAAFAGGPECSGNKTAAKGEGCTKTCAGSPEGFPAMTMSVNGKSYDCCMAAGKAAKDANAKIMYMIGDQKFDCKDAAMAALADASEEFVSNYTTIACVADGKVMVCKDKSSCCADKASMAKADGCCKSGAKVTAMAAKSDNKAGCTEHAAAMTAKTDDKGACPHATAAMAKSDGCCKAGAAKAIAMTKEQIDACCKNAKEVKYMVYGRTFKTRDEAVKAMDKAAEALKGVKLTYVVDGKEVDCASKVCPVAKKEGKVTYVLGKEKMNCEIEARIALAKAQYQAARDFAEKLAKI